MHIGKTDNSFYKGNYKGNVMDIKELNYLVTIADEGSISRAAEKLYMAQSSLSQFLQLYELELGTRLFVRTNRGVRLTASGDTFISHARQILQHYRQAQNELWDIHELQGGYIEFGISSFRGTYLLPRVLKRFHERYPNIHVETTELDAYSLEEKIMEGLLDIALVVLPCIKFKGPVDFLMKEEILLIISRGHPAMKYIHYEENGRKWIDLRDTAEFEYILGPTTTVLGSIARKEFKKIDMIPFARNTNFTAAFAAAMAREGIALAFTYRTCIVPDENVEYVSIGREGLQLDLALIYPVGNYRSNATRALAALFKEFYS